jgi:hypothetical protein
MTTNNSHNHYTCKKNEKFCYKVKNMKKEFPSFFGFPFYRSEKKGSKIKNFYFFGLFLFRTNWHLDGAFSNRKLSKCTRRLHWLKLFFKVQFKISTIKTFSGKYNDAFTRIDGKLFYIFNFFLNSNNWLIFPIEKKTFLIFLYYFLVIGGFFVLFILFETTVWRKSLKRHLSEKPWIR